MAYTAAEQGVSKAQFLVSMKYQYGFGVTKDYVLAYKWALLAAAQSSQFSPLVEAIKPALTPKQKAEAKAQAAAFVPKVTPKPEQ